MQSNAWFQFEWPWSSSLTIKQMLADKIYVGVSLIARHERHIMPYELFNNCTYRNLPRDDVQVRGSLHLRLHSGFSNKDSMPCSTLR